MAFVTISRLAARKGLIGIKPRFLLPQAAPALTAPCHSTVLSHEERNKQMQRPLSPHLLIYKFEFPTILSISHRISGILWSTYVVGFSAAALTMSHDFNHYMSAFESMNVGVATITTMKFLLAFPMMFHTTNGVRHLLWDRGMNMDKQGVVKTGVVMLGAATLATLAALML